MDPLETAVYVLVGAAVGFINTLASSGSAVSLPILIMLGLEPAAANATNRLPVLVGALSAVVKFHREGTLDWRLALQLTPAVVLGSIAGAAAADFLPSRDLALFITGAVVMALLLLIRGVKQILREDGERETHICWHEHLVFAAIGFWLGFIVLDGATYLLLALILLVHCNLIQGNALKSFLLLPSAVVALAVFASDDKVVWPVGAVLALGSIGGAWIAAHLASHPAAKIWVYRLLVTVILLECLQLAMHYVLQTA